MYHTKTNNIKQCIKCFTKKCKEVYIKHVIPISKSEYKESEYKHDLHVLQYANLFY